MRKFAGMLKKIGGVVMTLSAAVLSMASAVHAGDLPVSLSDAMNSAIKADTSGYSSPLTTEWATIAVGQTTSKTGASMTSLTKTTGIASKFVGWSSSGSIPIVYANISGAAALYSNWSSVTKTVAADEILIHPGRGYYAQLRFTMLKSGANALRFNLTDLDVVLGVGIDFQVMVNGTRVALARMDNNSAVTFTASTGELEVGDVVDAVLSSRKSDGADTQCDSTAVGITLYREDTLVYAAEAGAAAMTYTAKDDFDGFSGEVDVHGSTVALTIPSAVALPGDPTAPAQAVFHLTNSATLKVEQNWTSGATRAWDFGAAGRPTIDVASGCTLEIDGTVSGSCGLLKTGSGTLILTPTGKSAITINGEGEIRSDWTLKQNDQEYLQGLLDARGAVTFPAGNYEIEEPLVIHSATTLTCEEGAVFKLKNGANCAILVNEHELSGTDGDITIIGGVWDGNNVNQTRASYVNPATFKYGQLMMLSGVTNLTIRGVTFKDPNGFSLQLMDVENFLVEDIVFDCNRQTLSQDGVHVNGFARHGIIRRLSGQTNDDIVALNADEGDYRSAENDISDVLIEDIDGGDSGWTGVRLLSRYATVSNVVINGLRGKFEHYAVCFTHWANTYVAGMGHFHDITLSNITATCALKTSAANEPGLVWFQDNLADVGEVTIANLARWEDSTYKNTVNTIHVGPNVHIAHLKLVGVGHSVFNSQELVHIESSATIASYENIAADQVTAVKAKWERKMPVKVSVITNRLSEALHEAFSRQQNPVSLGCGSWKFANAAGTTLSSYVTDSSGFTGFGSSSAYPIAWINSRMSSITLSKEDAVAPGETRIHPGSTSDLGLRFTFTTGYAGWYTVSVRAKALNNSWNPSEADGVEVSYTDPVGGSTVSVTTTQDRATHEFTCPKVQMAAGIPMNFDLGMRARYNYDGSGLEILVMGENLSAPRQYSKQEVSLTSNANLIASWNPTSWPVSSFVNDVEIGFGQKTSVIGDFTSFRDRYFLNDLPSLNNSSINSGTDAHLPRVSFNTLGRDVTVGTDYPLHADEVAIHPSAGVYSALRFRPTAAFRTQSVELVFRLRDLDPRSDIDNRGEEIFIVRNGTQIARALLDKGGELELVQPLEDFGSADTIDFVMRSRYNDGASVQCDQTALSVVLRVNVPEETPRRIDLAKGGIAVSMVGGMLTVGVAAGTVAESDEVRVVWDSVDRGEDVGAWTHTAALGFSVGPEGVTNSVNAAALGIADGAICRIVLFGAAPKLSTNFEFHASAENYPSPYCRLKQVDEGLDNLRYSFEVLDCGTNDTTCAIYAAYGPDADHLGAYSLVATDAAAGFCITNQLSGLSPGVTNCVAIRWVGGQSATTNVYSALMHTLALELSAVELSAPTVDAQAKTVQFSGSLPEIGEGNTEFRLYYGPNAAECTNLAASVSASNGDAAQAFASAAIDCATLGSGYVAYRYTLVQTIDGAMEVQNVESPVEYARVYYPEGALSGELTVTAINHAARTATVGFNAFGEDRLIYFVCGKKDYGAKLNMWPSNDVHRIGTAAAGATSAEVTLPAEWMSTAFYGRFMLAGEGPYPVDCVYDYVKNQLGSYVLSELSPDWNAWIQMDITFVRNMFRQTMALYCSRTNTTDQARMDCWIDSRCPHLNYYNVTPGGNFSSPGESNIDSRHLIWTTWRNNLKILRVDNNTLIANNSNAATTNPPPFVSAPLTFFMYGDPSVTPTTYKSDYRVHNVKICDGEGGLPLLNFVPAKQNGVVGFYDTVRERFFASGNGSYQFVAGAAQAVVPSALTTMAASPCVSDPLNLIGTGGEMFMARDGSGDIVHVFKGAGEHVFTAPTSDISVRFLIVGGGGAGGYHNSTGGGGGGGGGGALTNGVGTLVTIPAGESCKVVVGAGGVPQDLNLPAGCGGDSSITIAGTDYVGRGGGAGGRNGYVGLDGGNSGGGASSSKAAGAVTQKAMDGSTTIGFSGSTAHNSGGGGGGGAGEAARLH